MSTQRFTFDLPPLQLALFDLGGVLYHANYLLLLEQTREAFLRAAGVSGPELAQRGAYLAITESRQNYVKPVRYGDVVIAELWAVEVRAASVVLAYSLQSVTPAGVQEVVHVAETRMAYVSSESGTLRPAALPEELKTAFESILGRES